MRKDVFQSCLTLYPESVWNEQMDLLRKKLITLERETAANLSSIRDGRGAVDAGWQREIPHS